MSKFFVIIISNVKGNKCLMVIINIGLKRIGLVKKEVCSNF